MIEKSPDKALRLSIGMPIMNGGETMGSAIDSILAQDFEDFELLIADNASTDHTQEVAQAYCRQDRRVRYVRHERNIGAFPNFLYVLENSQASYFMWAAADDVWSSDFARVNVEFLESNPNHISSISSVYYQGDDVKNPTIGDDVLRQSPLCKRITDYLSLWHGNSVFYSIFRRQILYDSLFPIGSYLGYDWAVMLRATVHGPSMRLDQGSMRRGKKGLSSAGSIFKASRSHKYHWLLPFFDVGREALNVTRGQSLRCRWHTAVALARLNYMAFRDQLYFELRSAR